jgi:predicted permease
VARVALVLLTVSVFLYRAFAFELDQGPGYRTDRLLIAAFEPGLVRYDDDKSVEFFRQLKERTLALPGVSAVSWSSFVPMKVDTFDRTPVAPEGFTFQPGTENLPTMWARVDEHYFGTMGIGIVAGRAFTATDTASAPPVAIVNETMARRYWPGRDPLGKRIRLDQHDGVMVQIVGVAADSKNVFIAMDPLEMLYVPRLQHPSADGTLLVHTDGPPAIMAGPLRDVVRALDPDMPVFGVRTMEDFYFSRATYVTRLIAGTVGAMGAMGVGLAVVGLYGLVAYAASRRTREIGIRMAIGAHPGSVRRMVLRHGFMLTICGLAAGAAGTVGVGRLLPVAFDGFPRIAAGLDAATLAIVVPVLVAVTMLATYLPARRAARIDPLAALRQE